MISISASVLAIGRPTSAVVGRGWPPAADARPRGQGVSDLPRRSAADGAAVDRRDRRCPADSDVFAEMTQTLVAKTIQPVKKALRDAGLRVETSRAWSWSAVRRGCRKSSAPSASSSARSRSTISTGQGRRLGADEPTSSPATAAATTTGCCSTSSRCRLDWKRWRPGRKSHSRNSTIPSPAPRIHHLQRCQTAMAIHVVQGERELVSDCRSLARFELRAFRRWSPARRASASPFRSTPMVCCRSRRVNRPLASRPRSPSSHLRLSDDEIAGMLQDSLTNARTMPSAGR